MNRKDTISDEQLSAFIDNELETEEESRIFELSDQSSELDSRICQQRKLKEMVQHAYRNVPPPEGHGSIRGPKIRFMRVAAALLLLATGVTLGWLGSDTLRPVGAAGNSAGMQQAAAVATTDSILLHLTSSDPKRMQMALRRADELINDPDAGANRRVEIIANENGIDLLRSDVSPHAEQVRALIDQDVLFFACSKAIQNLERQGVEVRLLPDVNSSFSALDRVVLRMQDDWEYIKL